MDSIFQQLFIKAPQKEENKILYFGNENDGDCFEKSNVDIWRNGEFRRNWRQKYLIENNVSKHLLDEIISKRKYVIDLACGPGMGLIPSVKQLDPLFPCMATDANPLVVKEWQDYLANNETYNNVDFAQFSVFNLPFKSNAVQAYSSYIGISSTRSGESGHVTALSEIHRTLARDGLFYTIENEWTSIPKILEVFDKMHMKAWTCFDTKQMSWHDRFIESGFEILYEEVLDYRNLRADDNELGAAAVRFGIDVGMKFTAYIVGKSKTQA